MLLDAPKKIIYKYYRDTFLYWKDGDNTSDFNIMRGSPYASTTYTVELNENVNLYIIQEFHDLDHSERMDREALFMYGPGPYGMDIAHTYQPRDHRTGRFAPRVQLFGA